MVKRKELKYAAEGKENPFFAQDNSDPFKIYLVDQERFDSVSLNDFISCQVLEYEEQKDLIIYRRKNPEMFVDIQRSLLSGLLLTD